MKISSVMDKMIVAVMNALNKVHLTLVKNEIIELDNPNNYKSLLPNTDSDKNKEYTNLLKLALEMPDVNNIAITGPYGSGKSSFLRGFEKHNPQWKYLSISLATFKDLHAEPIDTTTDEAKSKKSQMSHDSQAIERSILQQLFYKVKDTKIPYSRFKRIKSFSSKKIFLYSLSFLYLVAYFVWVYFPQKIEQLLNLNSLSSSISEITFLGMNIFKYSKEFFFLLALGLSIYYIYRLFKYLINLQISKFNFKRGEITLAKQEEASILNQHIDEIIYFFEVTDYDVIVFEDLDRFDNAEIFIKLRELNLLINNSDQIKRPITFIYALRDEMFEDKDRTKFFDFIVPIIPYINPSNSYDKIADTFQNEEIEQIFLQDISLYIDDMRLLVNIYNEYIIYKLKIGDKLDKTKLLAMIIYKNFYPADFSKLHFKGALYTLFQNKNKYIDTQIKNYLDQIDKAQGELDGLKKEEKSNIEELRMIYLYQIAKKVNSVELLLIDKQGRQYQTNIFNLIQEDFEILDNNNQIRARGTHLSTTFSEIDKEVGSEHGYFKRKQIIEDKGEDREKIIKDEIEKTLQKIDILKSYNLKEIIEVSVIDILDSELDYKDKDILKFFLRRGYIDEDYNLYISYFFEGQITQDDQDFLLSIKNNKPMEATHQLRSIDEVVRRLSLKEFNYDPILNHALTTFMLENNYTYPKKHAVLFSKISDGTENSRKFIFDYLEHGDNTYQTKFIQSLSWDMMWSYIVNDSDFSDVKINKLFSLLLNTLEIERLVLLNSDNSLKYYIEKETSLRQLSGDELEKFKALILKLGVKYKYIENPNQSHSIFNHIYENNLYELNTNMINKVAFTKGAPQSEIEEKLKTEHLTTLRETHADKLLAYIEDNIEEYIQNVFLTIETNINESEETLVDLLNIDSIHQEIKINIIVKESTRVFDITKISDKSIWKELIICNKIEANWDNLLYYYLELDNSDELDQALVDYFNMEENYIVLGSHRISKEDIFDENDIKDISRALLLNNNINDAAYLHLIESIPYWYSSLDYEKLSPSKVDALIVKKKLQLSQENIDSLKQHFPDKHIELIEKLKEKFLEEYSEIELDNDDILKLLRSTSFEHIEKLLFMEKIDINSLDSNRELIEALIKFFLRNSSELAEDLFVKIFELSHNLKLLAMQTKYLDSTQISSYLESLDSPYSDLAEKSASPLRLENNEENRLLIEALESKKYVSSAKYEESKIKVNRRRN